ncbi:MAG: 4-carboxy-4-hydroxy-2-oxoadipate aldolase/oxaloacetate decarboxylase [Firmicutes bacterium]|nr:4-carboxy-4-hydroxy-2-oxoadipate aldolase/oxaloacetate decarboxylase [Alicyclobacillaceae bacterium]MCL6497483.1 4-carboxy-4-hydroxy-2-oxoadipate aldolase/oxaloacetate decarboxylase [Bacillota bacterium]
MGVGPSRKSGPRPSFYKEGEPLEYYVAREIVRHAEDSAWAERLRLLGAATVGEGVARTAVMQPRIRPIQTGVAIAGRAVTAICAPGDNLMVHVALQVIQPGDVLVVGSWAPLPNAVLGELLATGFRAHGAAGAVVDGGVRDVQAIRALGFPVWADHVTPLGNTKSQPGWVNAPVVVGGVTVHPGDFVVADDDGVVVIPGGDVAAVLRQAEARREREALARARFARGEFSVDFYHLGPTLEALGVRWRSTP